MLISVRSAGQITGTDSLMAAFDRYRTANLQEKIFVHTDRSNYLSGELMWFKVYDVDASFHKPSVVSSVAYVELLDKDNKPVLQTKVGMKDGKGNGSLYLPVSLGSGNYRLRTYTRWMRNFAAEFYFEKDIRVLNTVKEQYPEVERSVGGYDVQFFPEGGNLIKGMESKIAFRVTDQTGKGIAFNGKIMDEGGRNIISFKPLRFGIGSFVFTPHRGVRYTALLEFADGRKVEQPLPGALDQGYVMSLKDEGDKLILEVSSNIPNVGEAFLFVHAGHKIEFGSKVLLNNGHGYVSIQKEKLHEGISHFTLFDNDLQPVCERLYFNKAWRSRLAISSQLNAKDYATRKKVTIDIKTRLFDSTPTTADLSVSVYKTDSLQKLNSPDILSYLLLSSELKGGIEEPEFYFSDTSEDVSFALDNLMLSHGWRRFKWREILRNDVPEPKYIPERRYHIVSARVFDRDNKLPAGQISTNLAVLGDLTHYVNGRTNPEGRVDLFTKDLFGVRSLVLQTNTGEKAYTIDILTPFSDTYSSRVLPQFVSEVSTSQTLLLNSINMQAWNIYNKQRLNKFAEPGRDSIPFYGSLKERYLLDNYVRFPTIEEVLREYVLSVGVRRKEGKLAMQVYSGVVNQSFFEERPLVFLDGVPMLKPEKFFEYDPLKIKSIEVLPKKYFFGPDVYGGIILFSTYKNNLEGMELDRNAVVIDYEALQLTREFYSPRYDTPQQLKSRLPDFRNLCFWAPEVVTDKEGNAKLDFYTPDRPGIYVVDIQGLTPEGKAGSFKFNFNVQ